jgi:hypothetical protein
MPDKPKPAPTPDPPSDEKLAEWLRQQGKQPKEPVKEKP